MSRIAGSWIVLAALVAACDDNTGPQVPMLLVSDTVLAARGDTVRLWARADGNTATAGWESLNPSIVTVTEDGLATAVAPGNARVRASFRGAEALGTVSVLPPVDIQVSELAHVTDPGGTPGVRMRIRNLGGRGFYALEIWKLDPGGAKRRIVSYNTEFEAEPGLDIEHVNYLSGEAPDWVVIYSREPLENQPVRTACARVDGAPGCPNDLPDPPMVHSVVVTPGAAVLDVGDSILYQAQAYDANGAEISGGTVTWHTPSPAVVRLDERGMLTALSPGYGQVEATIDGVQGSVGLTVTVPAPTVDSVWVGPDARTVAVGDTVRYSDVHRGPAGGLLGGDPLRRREIRLPRPGAEFPERAG
ncbi:MAG: Ig-like domain-containing protein [Longimicrobiales bacterium]|nr:Ig-like domain-containing protein [Longimicrobiales bacterium]